MTTIALRSATSLWRAPWKARNVDTGWPGQSHGVRFDLVTDPAAFETLEPEWDALFAEAGRPTQVFQTFAWNWHWCRHYLDRPSRSRSQLASSPAGSMNGSFWYGRWCWSASRAFAGSLGWAIRFPSMAISSPHPRRKTTRPSSPLGLLPFAPAVPT